MRFKLTKQFGVIVAEADSINTLDFSHHLHHCIDWAVWVTCDDGIEVLAALIDWSPSASYIVYNEHSGDEICTHDHWMVVPIVRAVINYNTMFSFYTDSTLVKPCRVYPRSERCLFLARLTVIQKIGN
jgi:hypothetical protein